MISQENLTERLPHNQTRNRVIVSPQPDHSPRAQFKIKKAVVVFAPRLRAFAANCSSPFL